MTRVLLLADDPSIAQAAAARLAEDRACEVASTASVADAIERLARDSFDFVVVDRVEDCLAVAKRLEAWLQQADAGRATLLVPTATAFGLQRVLASTVQHVRDLVAVIENAIDFRLSQASARA
jgi:DNA-binding NtrC family response regulator